MNSTLTKMASSSFMLIMLITLIFSTHATCATSLTLTLITEQYYNLGEKIVINGTLTLNGSPVEDGLVSIQINNPRGSNPEENLFLVRTVQTGPTEGPWLVEIIESFTCDAYGNPESSFTPGGGFGFKLTIKNNGASPQHVIVPLTLCYSNGIPFATVMMMDQTIDQNATVSRRRWIEEQIPGNAPSGTAHAYAVALNNWTQYGGIAWCPEKPVAFNITSSKGSLSTILNTNQRACLTTSANPGTFNITFMISGYGGILGNYTVYATSLRELIYFASDQKTFEALLIADVIEDGIVDMADISVIIDAFLTTPDDPEWNPRADINHDNIIDMADISIAIDEYLKEGQY